MAVELDEMKRTNSQLAVEAQARNRFAASDPDSGAAFTTWRKFMHLYDPKDGDQWPEDLDERPERIHLTLNIIKPAVDVASRIQSIPPRLSLDAANPADHNQRLIAEALEKMHYAWLQATDWTLWLNDMCRVKSIVGRTYLKPIWDAEENRPDVVVIEQPHRLRIGWRGNDYRKMDWALFEYRISPMEARVRWPKVTITPTKGDAPLQVMVTDHTDPLDTIPNSGFSGLAPGGGNSPEEFTPDEYESKQVSVWDYWYKRIGDNGKPEVCNAILLEGKIVEGPTVHSEYPDIPFIPVENDHRPGSPLGISDVKALIDLQDAMNRAMSSYTQLVADNSDPAWQLVGENAHEVEAGTVPKANEVVAPGPGNSIQRIDTGVNNFPVDRLIDQYWTMFHKITGLTEALFGALPGSQTSGRALAVQIEAAGNRLGPRRDRLYAAIVHLFRFWRYMLEANNATIQVPVMDEETGEPTGEMEDLKLAPLFKQVGQWKILPPEITPRDVAEHITNVANKVNAKLSSLKKGMDEVGVESPEEMQREIIEERNNADLFPADVQTKAAVMALLQQLAAQQQQQEQMGAMAQAQSAANNQVNEQMAANPQLGPEDGGEMAGMPASQPGAPGGSPLQAQTLLRGDQETGQVENLQQIAIR